MFFQVYNRHISQLSPDYQLVMTMRVACCTVPAVFPGDSGTPPARPWSSPLGVCAWTARSRGGSRYRRDRITSNYMKYIAKPVIKGDCPLLLLC